MIRSVTNPSLKTASLEHAPFPKVIRFNRIKVKAVPGLEHAPFPKVIRLRSRNRHQHDRLEHAPFPKVIRYVRTEKPL